MKINIPKRFFISMMLFDLVVMSGYLGNVATFNFIVAIVSYLLCGIFLMCKIRQEDK